MKKRIATAWLTGCSGCHMSFLDLDDGLIGLLGAVDLVYSPIADVKTFPPGVDVTLVEGAVSTSGNLELARRIRANSRVVVAFGDCAVTGNVPALRNRIPAPDLLAALYGNGFPGAPPPDGTAGALPGLLPLALPLHRAIAVDAFIPGCPPGPERIRAALAALLEGRPLALPEEMRTFG
jgi:NAD-reducing hydrogenase small subunit